MDFSHILNSKKITLSVVLSVFLSLLACKSFAIQSEKDSVSEKNAKQEAFNPTTAILEHIGDSHYWHVGGKLSIPLPVIIFTEKGMESFSASKFNGEGVAAGKFHNYKLVDDKIR